MSLISHPARPLLGLAVAVALAGCAATATKPTAVEANITTKAVGYLDKSAVPASLDLVPAPPVAGSTALALDEQVSREARALRGSPRFAQAGIDAELGFPEGANHFSCAADIDVDAVKTPALYRLLERSRIDASAATKAAKNHYQRPRPFMVNGEPTCSPKDEDGLRKNGSYPSGHTSIGWAWALILSEIVPDRADAIQARYATTARAAWCATCTGRATSSKAASWVPPPWPACTTTPRSTRTCWPHARRSLPRARPACTPAATAPPRTRY